MKERLTIKIEELNNEMTALKADNNIAEDAKKMAIKLMDSNISLTSKTINRIDLKLK